MLASHVDLKKAFDSVHHKTLRDDLCLHMIHAGIISLLTGLYSGTECYEVVGGGVSSFFPVNTGVMQG